MYPFMIRLAQPFASAYWKRRVLAPEIANSDEIRRALVACRARWPETSAAGGAPEAPIFLFAAGWGSGSTLLQRLIMSDPGILLWGEPHDHALPIGRLAAMIAPISDRWPRASYFAPRDSDAPLSSQWIANLSPQISALQSAHQEFLRAWLQTPATSAEFPRWGLKEVRLTADHARFLKWLFPNSRFVFLYRDVLKSYLSCRHVKWLSVWPKHRVNRVSSFAHHWQHLVSGFLEAEQELGAFVVRYESLIEDSKVLEQLAHYLKSDKLDASVLDVRLGSRAASQPRLSAREEAILRAITDPLRRELGYS